MAPVLAESTQVSAVTDERTWAREKREFLACHRSDDALADSYRGLLATEFARFTSVLLDATTVAEVLNQVVSIAHRVIPGADLVSVTLRSPDGDFHTPVETDPVASALDKVQYKTGEGPCIDAACATGPAYVRSTNLMDDPNWPHFGPAAAAHGYNAVLATALLLDRRVPQLDGALNIYARCADALDERAHDIALLLATCASLSLAHTQAVELAELKETQLRAAIESRDVIGQAKGILMHRRGITADEAFDLLRRTSQDLNVKLTEVARTLAARHTDLGPPEH